MTAIRDTTPGGGVSVAGVMQMPFEPPSPSEPNVYGLDKRVSLLEHMIKVQHKQLESINANLSRLVWIVIVAVVGGMISLVIRSGGVAI